jgi:hypothetical protein
MVRTSEKFEITLGRKLLRSFRSRYGLIVKCNSLNFTRTSNPLFLCPLPRPYLPRIVNICLTGLQLLFANETLSTAGDLPP